MWCQDKRTSHSKRTSRPRRDTAVAGKLHRRLNDTDANP